MSSTATEQGAGAARERAPQSGGGKSRARGREQQSAGAGTTERGGGKSSARGQDKQSAGAGTAERVPPRLKERYRAEIAPALREEFDYSNVMQIPGLVKISVNMGVGEAARDAKLIEGAVKDLAIITGQKPAVARAKKSIAQFKLRAGMPIGAHVTLRGDRMWEFLDRLLTLALPRIRDFRGLSDRQFDGRGNYTFGLTEQLMFHEINPDQVDRQRGMDVTVVTTATNDDEGRALLRRLGFPFKEN
jgi:large subunit ribosomal protein L5